MGIVFPHFYNIASARHYKTDPHDILFTSQNNKQILAQVYYEIIW